MLREEGEVQVKGYATSTGADGHVAVAVTDHVGIVGSYSYGHVPLNDCAKAPGCDNHRHHFGEAGVGYTTRFRDGLIGIETYAGYGYGSAESFAEHQFFGTEKIAASGRYGRFYLQPGFFFDFGSVQIGWAHRISRVRFHRLETNQEDWKGEGGTVFLEPTFTLRWGGDSVAIVYQTGAVIPVAEDDPPYHHSLTFGGIGIQARLNEIFW